MMEKNPKCARCKGMLIPDEDGMLKCINCGRRVPAAAGPGIAGDVGRNGG